MKKELSKHAEDYMMAHFQMKVEQAIEQHRRELLRQKECETFLKNTIDTINNELNIDIKKTNY